MSASYVFTTLNFSITSATVITSNTVRVTYSAIPLQVSSANSDDALKTANYNVTGPTYNALVSCASVSGDSVSIDLTFTDALSPGAWEVVVSNVEDTFGNVIGSPDSATFAITSTANVTSLTAGAENDTPARIIRKHLNPTLRGPNWDALIEALSYGDDIVWDNAQKALNQLFVASAEDIYLDQRASDLGMERPDIGMSDAIFRQLVIAYTSEKLTYKALHKVLEVFFGADATRAWVETELVEPYVLADAQTLEFIANKNDDLSCTVIFSVGDFYDISNATAQEVANAINKYLFQFNATSFAVPYLDYATNTNKVRIYSGALGAKSFFQVTGGTAQNFLRFPDYKDVYSGTVTSGTGYGWVYSNPTENQTKISLTTSGAALIDLSGIVEGDYVIIGADANSVTGVYTISAVDYYWSGSNLIQAFYIEEDLEFTGTATQDANNAYQFFTPKVSTTLNSGDQTVAVTSTTQNVVDVRIPATTQAVNRDYTNAAYLKNNDAVELSYYLRDEDGLLTVTTSEPHGFSADNQVLLEELRPQRALPWVTANTSVATGSSYTSFWSGTDAPTVQNEDAKAVTLANGDVLFYGGQKFTANVSGGSGGEAWLYNLGAETTDSSGTEANGAVKYAYTVTDATSADPRIFHTLTALQDGRALAVGGYDTAGPTVLDTAELYDPTTDLWASTTNNLTEGRFGHETIELDDGRILVMGGAIGLGTATNSCELWSPITNSWTAAADMNDSRYRFKAVKLDDGTVMAIGGMTLGQISSAVVETNVNNIIGLWKLDETSGTTAADAADFGGGGPADLTATNSPTIVDGKINLCRDFSPANSYLSGASTTEQRTALASGWLCSFWVLDDPSGGASDQTVISHGGAGELSADNVLLEIGFDATGHVYWKWEHTAGVDVTGTSSVAVTGPAHIQLLKRMDGAVADVSLYINGENVQNWANQVNADGGGSGQWYVARSAESAATRYAHRIDEILILPDPNLSTSEDISALEIANIYYYSMGFAKNEDTTYDNGRLLNTVEIYDPIGNTWTYTSSLRYARAAFEAILRADGSVAVCGGIISDPSRAVSGATVGTLNNWPNVNTNTVEIWDTVTARWRKGPAMPVAIVEPLAATLTVNEDVWFGGGYTYNSVYTKSVNPTTFKFDTKMNWSVLPRAMEVDRDSIGVAGAGVLVLGGGRNDTGNTFENADNWIQASDVVSAGGLNGQFKIETVPNSTSFTVQIPAYPYYSSNYGSDSSGQTVTLTTGTDTLYTSYSGWDTITTGARTSNVTTLTLTAVHTFNVDDVVFVNINSPTSLSSGLKTLTAVGTSTISYAETGVNVVSTAATGSVVSNLNSDATETPVAAVESSPLETNPGPYIYDPISGLPITQNATTLTSAIAKGEQTDVLTVASTTDFPDSEGYIVIDFGFANQSQPIKYLEKISSTELLLDYRFEFQANYPTGTSVSLLLGRSPVIPDPPDDAGTFYVTGSTEGRVVAEQYIEGAVAAGKVLNIEVAYPSDVGLGGQGSPESGDGKLSDIVEVYGE
jgi:hypothetical protein